MDEYHWTPALQRRFLETLAETGSVAQAAHAVSKSRRAAHNLKNRQAGFAFRIGWDAAILLSRDVVESELMDRALSGQWVETIRDKEAGTTRRHSHDRHLSMALLHRLDKRAEEIGGEGSFYMAAQLASQDFEAFLDLVEQGAGPAQIRKAFDPWIEDWTCGRAIPLCADFGGWGEKAVEVKAAVEEAASEEGFTQRRRAEEDAEETDAFHSAEVQPQSYKSRHPVLDTGSRFFCNAALASETPHQVRGDEMECRGKEAYDSAQSAFSAETAAHEKTQIHCELAQNSVTSETQPEPQPEPKPEPAPKIVETTRPFHPLPGSTPKPGEAGYHNWLMSQPWARNDGW
jgi:hypothetical protein